LVSYEEMQHWLIVERIDNWEADRANNFAFFGLPPRYGGIAAKINKGDKVYCYVSSSISAFSDIRVVREAGIRKLNPDSVEDIYNRDFAYYFSTSPVLVLTRERWVPLSQVVSKLEFIKDRTAWSRRAIFQTSIRKLSSIDASIIETAVNSAASRAAE
jgi:predicted RNA-binding protein